MRKGLSIFALALALFGGTGLVAPAPANADTKVTACKVTYSRSGSTFYTNAYCSTAAPGTHWRLRVTCPNGTINTSGGWLRQGSIWTSIGCQNGYSTKYGFLFTSL